MPATVHPARRCLPSVADRRIPAAGGLLHRALPRHLAGRVFTAIANTRMRQGIVGPTTQIGLGVLDAGAPGLVIGSILGQSASTLGLFRRAISPHRAHLRAVTWRRATALAWRYRRFPLIASWAALLDAAGGYSLLSRCLRYSARVAGFDLGRYRRPAAIGLGDVDPASVRRRSGRCDRATR